MFKAIILLTRAHDVTHEAFRVWWLEEHAPLARELAGLRRLVFNVVDDPAAPYDGVSELWFESREAFDAAYATAHGRAVAADSMAHCSGRVRLLADEVVQVG